MRGVIMPSEKNMKKAAASPFFNPRKYLKSINFKKMTMNEASQLKAMAEKVNDSLYEIVSTKLSKRPSPWDVIAKTQRCLQAIRKWDELKDDQQSHKRDADSFDYRRPDNIDKFYLEFDLHQQIIQCKDFDLFLQKHKEISRQQLIDHVIKVNFFYKDRWDQESEEDSASQYDTLQLHQQNSPQTQETTPKHHFWVQNIPFLRNFTYVFNFFAKPLKGNGLKDQGHQLLLKQTKQRQPGQSSQRYKKF